MIAIIVGLILLIIEIIAPTMLMFPIGIGLIIFDIANYIVSIELAATIAIIATIIGYYYTLKIAKSKNIKKEFRMPHEIEGKEGKIIKELENGYLVDIEGKIWRAKSSQNLKKGDKIIVERLESIIAIIRKKD